MPGSRRVESRFDGVRVHDVGLACFEPTLEAPQGEGLRRVTMQADRMHRDPLVLETVGETAAALDAEKRHVEALPVEAWKQVDQPGLDPTRLEAAVNAQDFQLTR